MKGSFGPVERGEQSCKSVLVKLQPTTNVVLDANILFSAAICHLLVEAAVSGVFRARWSDKIFNEAKGSLHRRKRFAALGALNQNTQRIRDPLVGEYALLEPLFPKSNAKDRHVAAAAKACGASYLVTDNDKHFDKMEAKDNGFDVLTADEFILLLLRTDTAAVVRAIDTTPPDRFWKYMERLKKLLPRSYELIAEAFRSAGTAAP